MVQINYQINIILPNGLIKISTPLLSIVTIIPEYFYYETPKVFVSKH